MSIHKFDEIVPDATIQNLIQKYALDEEVWWQRVFSDITHHIVNPETNESLDVHIPTTKIYLGTRGVLLGPEYNIWFVVTIDAVPALSKLESSIANAMEEIRKRKDLQKSLAN